MITYPALAPRTVMRGLGRHLGIPQIAVPFGRAATPAPAAEIAAEARALAPPAVRFALLLAADDDDAYDPIGHDLAPLIEALEDGFDHVTLLTAGRAAAPWYFWPSWVTLMVRSLRVRPLPENVLAANEVIVRVETPAEVEEAVVYLKGLGIPKVQPGKPLVVLDPRTPAAARAALGPCFTLGWSTTRPDSAAAHLTPLQGFS